MQYGDVRFDHILTRGAIASFQDMDMFAVKKSANMVTVEGDSSKYKLFKRTNISADQVEQIGAGSAYPRVHLNTETKEILCKDYGLEMKVPFKLIKELGGNVLQVHANALMEKGMIKMEKEFLTTALADAAFDDLQTGGVEFTLWSDPTSNPIKDIRDAIRDVTRKSGKKPNTITVTADVADELLDNQEIIDRLDTTADRFLVYERLASIFGVREFNVSEAVAGVDEDTDATLLETKKLLIHTKVDGDARLQPASVLVAVSNTAQDVVGTNGLGIYRYTNNDLRSEILALEMNLDVVIPATYSGKLFKNCIA